MRFFNYLCAGFLMWMSCAGAVFAQEAKLTEALPNIYCMVDPTGNSANSTFIVTEEGVIVIDTGGNEEAAGQVLQAIRKTTAQPVVYVVNSHFHKENVSGNGVFKSARTLIAQKRALAMTVLEAEREKRKITPANLAFEKKLELKLGKYHLKLIHPGPAHTDGDLYIYIPKWRTLITGGLVFNRIIPFLGDSYIESWLHALREMENLDAEVIVPGHGAVGGKPIVTQMKHYLMELKRFVNDALDDDKNLPDTITLVKEQLEPKYSGWKHFDRVDENIVRAYVEYSAKRGT
ncbi:MAG: MBL fold metallo-hydrolase [Nitrospinota bacterium]|nr:MBL fold metallo-hydrolase [Nitrospinota bacterium]